MWRRLHRETGEKWPDCRRKFLQGGYVFIDPAYPFLIEIGDNVTVAIRTVILSHDASCIKVSKDHLGKFGSVKIEDNVFIGAHCTILPDTYIGENSIIGAGSVVSGNIPKNSVACGNPARVICSVEEYVRKHEARAPDHKLTLKEYDMKNKETQRMMKEAAESGIFYI